MSTVSPSAVSAKPSVPTAPTASTGAELALHGVRLGHPDGVAVPGPVDLRIAAA